MDPPLPVVPIGPAVRVERPKRRQGQLSSRGQPLRELDDYSAVYDDWWQRRLCPEEYKQKSMICRTRSLGLEDGTLPGTAPFSDPWDPALLALTLN